MLLLTNLRLAFTRILTVRPHRPRRSLRIQTRRIAQALVSCEQLEERVLLSGAPLLRDFTVMSQNLYLGTDLNPIIAALDSGSLNDIVMAVSAGWQDVVASNFEERAGTLADQVLDSQPTIIGLQEASLWQLGTAFDEAAADQVAFDFLDIFLGELAERGLHYEAVTAIDNFSAELPGFVDVNGQPSLRDIRLTDRDVILARTDLVAADLKVSNPQAGNFDFNLPLPGDLELTRGWTSVDVKIRGAEFRVINTHLENIFPIVGSAIQVAQAQEILLGPASTDLPTILLGDFNSRADQNGDVYQLVTGAGFSDVWTQTHPGEPGFTCCHDADLLNPDVNFEEGRIDWVLYRGDFLPLEMDLFNDDPDVLPPSGLWISDHAGLVASLVVSPLPPVAKQFAGTGAPIVVATGSDMSIGSMGGPSIDSLVGSAATGSFISTQLMDDVEEDDEALETVFSQLPLDDLYSPPSDESEDEDLSSLESPFLLPA